MTVLASAIRLPGAALTAAAWAAILMSCERTTSPSSPLRPGEIRWHVAEVRGFGNPAVTTNSAYFATSDHRVVAVSKRDGRIRWQATLPAESGFLRGQGVVAGAAGVFAGDSDVFALDPETGLIRWRFSPPLPARLTGFYLPTLDADVLYCGSASGHTYALNATTGEVKWAARIVARDPVGVFTPRVDSVNVYVAFADHTIASNGAAKGGVAALDKATGQLRWLRYLPHVGDTTAETATFDPVLSTGVVVVGARDGPVYALSRSSGSIVWSSPGILPTDFRPLAEDRGVVFAGSTALVLRALDGATGRQLWQVPTPLGSTGWMSASGGHLHFVYFGGQLRSFDGLTGEQRWARDESRGVGHPASDDSTIYVGGADGLFAIVR